MATIHRRMVYPNRSALAIALLMVLVGACGAESEVSNDASDSSKIPATQASSAEYWRGDSQGYLSQGDPAHNVVDKLIHLGHVQAAIGRANDHQKEDDMTNPFTPKVLAEYAVIDPLIVGQDRNDLSLYPLLLEVASAETFAIVVSQSSEQRLQRNAIHTQLVTLIGRVDSIVTEIFPSTQASALAMSALVREAGELLREGLSVDGQILEVARYRDALRLMEAALRLRVNKVSSCRMSSEANDQLKHGGPLGALLDRLILVSESGLVGANAGDAFALAASFSALGASLPAADEQICH